MLIQAIEIKKAISTALRAKYYYTKFNNEPLPHGEGFL